jgi:tetratricopeptide (TPR) repeat protein
MYIKTFKLLLSVALLYGLCAVSTSAQNTAVTGYVYLKQADGSKAPLKDAIVEFHRRDAGGTFKLKTDKSGKFVHVAIPLAGTYTILVSGPGASPTAKVKIPLAYILEELTLASKGMFEFVLEPGDGRAFTVAEVEKGASASKSSASNESKSNETSAEKAPAKEEKSISKEELEKLRKEHEAEKARVENLNVSLKETLEKGNAAFTAKKYEEAITFYDQGIKLDPDQLVFPKNKAIALRILSVAKYNKASMDKDTAGKEAAKAQIKTAVESIEKALTNARTLSSKASKDQTAPKENEEYGLLAERAETYRLALEMGVIELGDAGVKAMQEYIDKETDPVKKSKAEGSLANAMLTSGQMDRALTLSQQILTSNPNNLDAMYVLAIATANDPNKAAEARDMLKKFASKAPDNDPRKQMAEDTARGLDEVLKAPTPAKTDSGTKGRRKG